MRNYSEQLLFLCRQLMSLINLYNEEELAEYICPVALDLVCDKVAEVRENAYHLVSEFQVVKHHRPS